MSWFPDSIVDYAPSGSELGLIVRPIGGGLSGSLNVSIVSGTISIPPIVISNVEVTGSVEVTNEVNVVASPKSTFESSFPGLNSTRKKVRYDMPSLKTDPIYIGYALLGTSEASSSWSIKRITPNSSGDPMVEEWTASGSASWNNRSSEVYS